MSHLLHLHPPPPNVRIAAARSVTSLGVPLLVLYAFGRVDLGIYATFGAFAGVYGGTGRFPGRVRVQLIAATMLLLAVASGVVTALSPHRAWLAVPVVAVWAALAAHLSDRFGWRPPGPMFATFAAAACSAVPMTGHGIAPAVGTALATAGLAVALAAAEVRLFGADRLTGPPPDAEHPWHRQVVQMARCAAVVVVAGTISTAAGIAHPYWAMVAAVVPMAGHTYLSQITRGLHRVIGTAAGIAVAALLLALDLPEPAIVLLAAALQGMAELYVVRNYGVALLAITPLALLLVQVADPQPIGPLVGARLAETCIGVGVGLVAVIVTRERSRRAGGPAQSGT
ncbi:FUSC family protein [Kineosporia sp. J2-2]|uniref:FUSC family protein n=1 Tax=Kineosporia corallincola TaxID=2835133 RepID=A0ABS5TEE5_9ACTN|nr:FUSC family protein [Kineosporia corallincola]MBT0769420.1 FUSC family protein [Kineosporia corallincola]